MEKLKSILRRLLIDCTEAEVEHVAKEIMEAVKTPERRSIYQKK